MRSANVEDIKSIDILKDELYYQDQELLDAEKRIAKFEDHAKADFLRRGQRLIDNWPNLPHGE